MQDQDQHELPYTRPTSVEIVARGSSIRNYRKSAQVTWGITMMHLTIPCDLGWWMDDIHIFNTPKMQGIPEILSDKNYKKSPFMTSTTHPEMPDGREYPLQRVIDFLELKQNHTDWFNNTVAYAVAYAIYCGFKEIHMHGVDYSHERELRDMERDCTTFWLGVAMGRGIDIKINPASFLLARIARASSFDPMEIATQNFYGYVEKPKLNYK